VDRRSVLKRAVAAMFVSGLAPNIGLAQRTKTLSFVPVADVTLLDPVVSGNRPTRNYAYLVFDTLYGIDTEWQAQPEMVEGHDVAPDGLTWNLKVREGLRFHDKEPVLARDVVASIRPLRVARHLRDSADGRDRRAVGARRPHRALSLEAALPARAGGPGRTRR
jgi:peptide/nickel transport system substrate-binding protein